MKDLTIINEEFVWIEDPLQGIFGEREDNTDKIIRNICQKFHCVIR